MSGYAYVALFGAGVSTVAAPCVLPLLPAYVTVVLDAAARGGRAAVLGAGLAFVGGFSLVFVALGTAAGALGAIPGSQVVLTRVAAAVLVAVGLAVVLRPRGLSWWPTVRLLPWTGAGRGRWLRPFALGTAFAGTWTPCVGPLLGAALVTAGAGGDPLSGAGLLAVYSAGLSVPFLVLCLAAGPLVGTLPGLACRLGRGALVAQRVAGGLLVLLGLLLADGRPGWAGLAPVGG